MTEAKAMFNDYLFTEMIRDSISNDSIKAHLKTVEMIVGEEILNPDSLYKLKNFASHREQAAFALPWHKTEERQNHLLNVIECILLRHDELKKSADFSERINQLKQDMTEAEIKMVEVVAFGFWN